MDIHPWATLLDGMHFRVFLSSSAGPSCRSVAKSSKMALKDKAPITCTPLES